MKNWLLEKRYVGLGLAVIFSLIVAWVSTTKTALFLQTVTPYVADEVKDFMPVTFENGMIVEPKDAIITKEYAYDDKTIKVVLNTEVDELNSDEIKDSGIYFSRKFMYAVSPQKTEIRDFSDIPNISIDQEMIDSGTKWLESKANGYLFVCAFIILLIYIGIAVLIYAAISQLFIGKLVSTNFRRTLRISTLGYLALFMIQLLTGQNINILIAMVLIVLLNYFINKHLYHTEK